MAYIEYEKETAWKIVYSDFSGIEKRAVELLSRELGDKLNRIPETYILHILPCEKETADTKIEISAVVVGAYGESEIIRRFVSEEEIKDHSYIVKVVNNPDYDGGSIVLITAGKQNALYRAAARFLDDYTENFAPLHGSMKLRCEIFKEVLAEGVIYGDVKVNTRSIFAWGHAINDYRAYIRDMARQGLNQLILWNDFAPLNASEIVEYAHSFGIEIIWGYAWGWTEGHCEKIQSIDEETLKRLKTEIIYQYENVWRGLGDGIYFQSFTEMNKDNIGGRQIAAVVTDFVNEVAEEIFKRDPDLHLQFGLHALSVKNHFTELSRVDKRIEIVWEDCGLFPYAYVPKEASEEEFTELLKFTEKILTQRKDAPVGLVFKGFAVLDWARDRFVHQRGRYLLGDNSSELMEHDRKLRSDAWRHFSAGWQRYGDYARRVAELAYKITGGKVNLCMAGAFDGGIFAPSAICSDIFEDPEQNFFDIAERAVKRKCVRKD